MRAHAASTTLLLLSAVSTYAAWRAPARPSLSRTRKFASASYAPPTNLKTGPTPKETRSTILKQPAASVTRGRKNGLQLPTYVALPILSYAGLGALIAGAFKVLGVASWTTWAAVGFTTVLPAGFLVFVCMKGGTHIAERMGGVPADAKLTRQVHEAANAVGVDPPEAVYILPQSEPNAFAASNLASQSTTVAVTRGLRDGLTDNELKAVLAHEMGHLRAHDVVRNMHVAIAIAGFSGVYDLGRMLLNSNARSSSSSSSKKDDSESSSAGAGLMLMGAGFAAQIVAQLLRLAASRDAELKADRAAAEAFGSESIVSALQKIDKIAARRPADLRENEAAKAFAFAMISDGAEAAAEEEPNALWAALTKVMDALRTHPRLNVRVAALEKAAAEGEIPAKIEGGGEGFFEGYFGA